MVGKRGSTRWSKDTESKIFTRAWPHVLTSPAIDLDIGAKVSSTSEALPHFSSVLISILFTNLLHVIGFGIFITICAYGLLACDNRIHQLLQRDCLLDLKEENAMNWDCFNEFLCGIKNQWEEPVGVTCSKQ